MNDISLNMEPTHVDNAIQIYLRGNNFKYVSEKGDNYYKATGATLRGFKYWYNQGVLHIEAWIGKIGKEMDISDGKFVGALGKVPYYNSILSLLTALEQDRQAQQSTTGTYGQPDMQQSYAWPNTQQPYGQTNMQQPYAQPNTQQPYGQPNIQQPYLQYPPQKNV